MFKDIKLRGTNFYRDLQKLMVPNMSTHISNNNRIPNAIRNSDREIEMWITEIESNTTIRLTDFCQFRSKGSMYLHVLQNTLSNKIQKIQLKERSSIKLTEMAFNIELSVENTGSTIAIEWQKEYTRFVNPQVINDNFQIENSKIELTDDIIRKRLSYIHKTMTKQEINNVIVFLSSKYSSPDENGVKSLLAITILNSDKKVLYNTLVTPRRRVVDFDTRHHGISEMDSRGRMDEYKVITEIREILKGKIVVGYCVAEQLKNLCVKINQILGIRELSTALAIGKPSNNTSQDNHDFNFSELVEMFKINAKKSDIITFSEAETILDVYQQIVDKWKDHIYPKTGLEKESTNTLMMTILKDDNRTDKQDRTKRWKTQNCDSPKRRYSGDLQSVPSREAPITETSRWELKPLTNKEDLKIKDNSCSKEKSNSSGNNSQTGKRLKLEGTPSKQVSSNVSSFILPALSGSQSTAKSRIYSEATQHSRKPSDTSGNHIGTMPSKFSYSDGCFQNKKLSSTNLHGKNKKACSWSLP